MAYVKQRTKVDCGVACLAMICNVTYEEADKAIAWKPFNQMNGTDTKLLREAAERLGYEGVGTPCNQLKRLMGKSWDAIPDHSLVKIPHPAGPHKGWHWVFWKKGKVYCPSRGVFKPAKYGAEPTAYMEFHELGAEKCPECGTWTEVQWSGVMCPNCGWRYCA